MPVKGKMTKKEKLYQKIRDQYRKKGKPLAKAKELAARTVNKLRKEGKVKFATPVTRKTKVPLTSVRKKKPR